MKRFGATLIDYFVCYLFASIVRCLYLTLYWHIAYQYSNKLTSEFSIYNSANIFLMGVVGLFYINYGFVMKNRITVLLYITIILYFLITEIFFKEKTIGKHIFKISIEIKEREKNFKWVLSRIVLKVICLRFWYIVLYYYMQTSKMPYDKKLGITINQK